MDWDVKDRWPVGLRGERLIRRRCKMPAQKHWSGASALSYIKAHAQSSQFAGVQFSNVSSTSQVFFDSRTGDEWEYNWYAADDAWHLTSTLKIDRLGQPVVKVQRIK
jgi:hypothetical protein